MTPKRPDRARIAGRIRVPKGSMCLIGFNVNRPARLAVSSPNSNATAPCDTSCRMIDGTTTAMSSSVVELTTPRCTAMRATTPNSTTTIVVSRFRVSAPCCLRLRGALDAIPRLGFGFKARRGDRPPTRLARPVSRAGELEEGVLDLGQRLEQALGERLRFATLRGYLA